MLNLNSWKTRSHPWFRQRSGVCRLRNKLSRFTSTNIHVKNNSSCLTYMHFNCLKFVLGIHRSQPVWRDCNKKKKQNGYVRAGLAQGFRNTITFSAQVLPKIFILLASFLFLYINLCWSAKYESISEISNLSSYHVSWDTVWWQSDGHWGFINRVVPVLPFEYGTLIKDTWNLGLTRFKVRFRLQEIS